MCIRDSYNAAAGLAKCIETARRQTYGNIELLLVNDGSADSSPHICRMYARVDSRIRIIDKDCLLYTSRCV